MNIDALKFPDFRLYLTGNVFTLNATWMQRVTLGWIAWDLTASASFVGWVVLLGYAPSMTLGPLFGVLIDRIRVKTAGVVTQSSMCILTFMLFAAYGLGWVTPLVLSIFALTTGVAAAAHHPVRMSLAPRLVDRSAVSSVVTFVAMNFNLARLTGPALGGITISAWGVATSLFIQTVLFIPLIFVIPRLKPRPRRVGGIKPGPFLEELAKGVKLVASTEIIRRAMLVTAIFAFLIRGTMELLPVFADGVFNRGASGLGLLTSCAGFGAVCAGMTKALTTAQIPGRLPKVVLACVFLGICLVPTIGFSRNWELTLVLIVLIGFCGTMSGITMQTAIQLVLDDDVRGRVMSLWVMVGIGAAAIGAFVIGSLSDYFGIASTMLVTAIIGMILYVPIMIKSW